jgi:hypothetical protein
MIYSILHAISEKEKIVSEVHKESLNDSQLEKSTNQNDENTNSINAVDARIDILAEHCGITEDV